MKIVEERNRLESLLNSASDEISNEVPMTDVVPEELQNKPTMGINFAELKIRCDGEARVMLTNAIGFILPIEMITDNDYLKNKLEVDIMSLSGMLYQLKVNESMQLALMNEVDRGLIHPRMFEVFSGLSKTIAEINKQLIGTVEAIKSTYKEVKLDIQEKRNELLGPTGQVQSPTAMIAQGDGGVVTMGTKELIRQVSRQKTEDAKIIYATEQ